MPLISSPVAYPPSSSPQETRTKKRKRSDLGGRSPLRPKTANQPQRNGMFEEDSDSDESTAETPDQNVSNQGKENSTHSKTAAASRTKLNPNGATSLGSSIFSQPRKVAHTETDTSLAGTETALLITPPSSQGNGLNVLSTAGRSFNLRKRVKGKSATYEEIIAARSVAVAGKARRSYYGIDINALLETAEAEAIIADSEKDAPVVVKSVEPSTKTIKRKTLMWTEKYRARKFTDLVGDDRTHRTVMHWLKAWDPVVFPGATKRTHISKYRQQSDQEPKQHRKVLLLTGPPGLGKTTLAHVCARQAGYEVSEINASDDRSKDVVKGKIRDMLGTENVKSASTTASGTKKIAKPICVIVDEVDGVVSGSSGGGEGGFMKALIDLVLLDQKNARNAGVQQGNQPNKSKRKGDDFRMMRPLIMICNDAYHAALRPLRSSNLVEIIHCGRPALNTVALRVQSIFEKEGIGADGDAVRRLCESCWGTVSKKEGGAGAGAGEGDIRSILVMGEWIAGRITSTSVDGPPRLTKTWLETNMSDSTSKGNIRGLGRGGAREIVERVFMEGAGLSRPSTISSTSSGSSFLTTSVKSVNEALKSASTSHLRTLIDGHGESDRIMTDLFSSYPNQPFQDDNFLSKPAQAYEWLHFHDHLSTAVFSSSEWELAPYLSSPALGFHHLFATSSAIRARHSSYNKPAAGNSAEPVQSADEPHPFTLPTASFAAYERQKSHMALLQTLHESLSLPLTRLYPRPEGVAIELVPYLLRMLAPAVNPVLITASAPGQSKGDNRTMASVRKASEKALIERAVRAMLATGCRFEKHRVEPVMGQHGAQGGKNVGGWVFRLMPGMDEYGVYETAGKGWGNDVCGISAAGGRYGVRQVLVQECVAEERRVDGEKRGRRGKGNVEDEEAGEEVELQIKKGKGAKRDFFGREIVEVPVVGELSAKQMMKDTKDQGRIWIGFHEGYSNAVRKPITLKELMAGL